MTEHLPDILFSDGTPADSKRLGRWTKAGRLRKLLPGIYTSDVRGRDQDIIRRNWQMLVARKFPGVLLSHRSAMEYGPSPAANIYLTHDQNRVVRWPGLTLKLVKGHPATIGDRPFLQGLHVSSEERALLENLQPARRSRGERRAVDQEVVEARLLKVLDVKGEDALNALRDAARTKAEELGMHEELDKLDALIGALLATRDAAAFSSHAAKARASGEPYDTARSLLFDKLATALKQAVFADREERTRSTQEFRDLAFFESYFSNYIEGTEFEVEEAADIIYRDVRIPNRTGDSHDIQGTFAICSDRRRMGHIPHDAEELYHLLRERHAELLAGRPDKHPGEFKHRSNRAGNTSFVEPHLVRGTLKAGLERMQMLDAPFARAIYMMFLVSEVHPFTDGNGRIARVMMNAELVHAGMTKIIIPTVYREDYLLALRKLTRNQDPLAFIRMMDRAHTWTHWLEPASFERLDAQMHQSHAYLGSDKATLRWPQ